MGSHTSSYPLQIMSGVAEIVAVWVGSGVDVGDAVGIEVRVKLFVGVIVDVRDGSISIVAVEVSRIGLVGVSEC